MGCLGAVLDCLGGSRAVLGPSWGFLMAVLGRLAGRPSHIGLSQIGYRSFPLFLARPPCSSCSCFCCCCSFFSSSSIPSSSSAPSPFPYLPPPPLVLLGAILGPFSAVFGLSLGPVGLFGPLQVATSSGHFFNRHRRKNESTITPSSG